MKRSFRKPLAVAQVLALAGVLLSIAGPADARTQPRMTISPSIGTVQRSFPAFQGFSPPRALATQIKNCRDGQQNATYCDHIPITAAMPPNYKPIHKVRISMTWEKVAPTNNDLIMYLFPDPEAATDDALLNTAVGTDTAAGKQPPREIQVGEMAGTFTLNVTNQNAGNTGYTVKLEWILVDLGPDYAGPDDGGSSEPSFSPAPAKKSGPPVNPAFNLDGAKEEEETITVKVPGPDGELIDVEIPLVKAAGLSKKGETVSNPVVPIILGLLGLGLILFLYFFVWRRRRGEETA